MRHTACSKSVECLHLCSLCALSFWLGPILNFFHSGLFIFSESGKPVRYCSDGDFRSLINTVAQGSAAPRPGSAEVWDNSMFAPNRVTALIIIAAFGHHPSLIPTPRSGTPITTGVSAALQKATTTCRSNTRMLTTRKAAARRDSASQPLIQLQLPMSNKNTLICRPTQFQFPSARSRHLCAFRRRWCSGQPRCLPLILLLPFALHLTLLLLQLCRHHAQPQPTLCRAEFFRCTNDVQRVSR